MPVKLKHLLFDILYENKLNEKQTKNISVEDAADILQKHGYEIELHSFEESEIEVILYPHNSISELLKITAGLGFIPSGFVDSSGGIKPFSILKLQRSRAALNNIKLVFNKKLDEVVEKKDLPKYIYHLTKKEYKESIQQTGLKPRAKNKLKSHPPRVYFCFDYYAVEQLVSHPKFKADFVITVDTNKIKNTTFYYDPDFYGRGIYTNKPIPPEAITSILDIKYFLMYTSH